ncbi:hypothetical protein [Chitinophaga sp. RAB17]|uniref:hypothetical protein n=1 Tax=Chitinophaga sp. RAB17 TaxID=3233049 RepID=UPI003F90EECA
MKPVFIFLLLISFVKGHAQGNKNLSQAEFDTLTKKFIKNITIPREISAQCKSSAVSFIIKFDRKMNKNVAVKNEIIFSKNFPAEFKDKILSNLWVFESIKWEKLFSGVKGNNAYAVLVPIIYYLDFDCMEKIRSDEFANIVNDGLSFENYPQSPIFLLKPLKISISKPIP